MELSKRQQVFLDFVKECHGSQVRQYTGEPYWTHVYAVAEIVSEYEPKGIEIALGHDLLEDTDCTYDQLVEFLKTIDYSAIEAIAIGNGVHELTDVYTKENYPDKVRRERKQLEAERLGKTSSLAQSVKYADLIHNMSSIVEHDEGFARVFAKEKRDILNFMRAGNIDLLILCCASLEKAFRELEIRK